MRFLFAWGPALAVMAVIYAGSTTPNPPPTPEFLTDKLLHLAGYAATGFLLLHGLSHGRSALITRTRALVAFVLSVLYGASIELRQGFVPGRTPEVMDVVANTVGAAAGIGALIALNAMLRGHIESTDE